MEHAITKHNVKFLGRTLEYKGIRWCGHSGSGISFTFHGKKLNIVLRGDNTTEGFESEGPARIAVFVDHKRVVDQMMKEPLYDIAVIQSESDITATVEIVKLSECAMSVFGIKSIVTDETATILPTPDKLHKIEFAGDSITCGYGIDMNDPSVGFKTSTEDTTKAYAYHTAMSLNADYSMVSFSGYGVVSGFTDTEEKNLHSLVPTFYEKVGFSYAHPLNELVLEDIHWDFAQYQPEVVIVNLGTNDASYCKDIKERIDDYTNCYVAFLKMIRKHNKNATIIGTLGLMGQSLYPAIESAMEQFKLETKDANVYSVLLDEQKEEDGYVSDMHPSVKSNQKASDTLSKAIKAIMNW